MRYRISVDTGGTFTDVVVMTGSVYGVILAGRIEDKSLTVDDDRTGSLRQEMSAASQTRDRF
jgi:N-methylhydantoinase A/oxoprolinase/acetone carboxylase beta subunit